VLTRLTKLELGSEGHLSPVTAALLSASLAPLGRRLRSVETSEHARSEGALKRLPCGRSRLNLSYVGIDDSLVDDDFCSCLASGLGSAG
jgi:hypothetical protein